MAQHSKNSFYNFHFTDGNKYFEFFRRCCKLALAASCIKRSHWNCCVEEKVCILFETPAKQAEGIGRSWCVDSWKLLPFQSLPSSLFYLMFLQAFQCSGITHPGKKKKKKSHQTTKNPKNTPSCKVTGLIFIHHQKSSFKGCVPLHIILCHYSTDFNRKTRYFKPLKLKNNFWYSVFSY